VPGDYRDFDRCFLQKRRKDGSSLEAPAPSGLGASFPDRRGRSPTGDPLNLIRLEGLGESGILSASNHRRNSTKWRAGQGFRASAAGD
jgi:hypothetical protein